MVEKLKKPGFIGLLLTIGLLAVVMVASAQIQSADPFVENLYYSDTGSETDGTSSLYHVDLDTASGHAILTLLPGGLLNFNHVDVIAVTPDGATLYFIDSGPSQLLPSTMGSYEFATGLVETIGLVTLNGTNLTGFDQAAFSPLGTLYATSTLDNNLYSLDLATAAATLVGPVINGATAVPLDIGGGDIGFGADGTMYLWINLATAGAPRGLYTLTVPPAPGDVMASYVGESTDLDFFNGMAIRANGYGDIAASSFDDLIHLHGKDTGNDVADPFPMYLNGAPFDATGGDMSNGALALCLRTLKYWATNSWNGQVVTIVGVDVDQTLGYEIFGNISSDNFSRLISQLVVAKLNVNNSTGVDPIDEIESWLADQGLVNPDGSLNYSKPFVSRGQRVTANQYFNLLVLFNNKYKCRPTEVFQK
jgi:hypothetical protein